MPAKLSILHAKELASQHNGKCLSEEYINSSSKLEWKCSKLHIWEATYNQVQSNHWCPECGGTKKLNIDTMRHVAKERGGICLSQTYSNVSTPLTWKCSKGHIWETPYHGVIDAGAWCPVCRDTKNSINDARELAQKHNGKCLSTKYINNYTPLLWRCSCGYKWKAIYANVQQSTWCPYCSYNRDNIETMYEVAKERGGKCLSNSYVNSSTKLEWLCKNGHRWKATGRSVKHGSWCSVCAGNLLKTLTDMQALASKRDGKCLSKHYVNVITHLEWECADKHKWFAIPSDIKRGRWCPECNSKKNAAESKCREIIEELTGLKFPCTRRVLGYELDMYNEQLNLAFEYNGRQHYIFTPQWHRTPSGLINQQKRDAKKKRLCKRKGVTLEVIHYKISSSDSRLRTFLKDKLIKHGVPVV